MLPVSHAFGLPSTVGPRVIQVSFYAGLAGAFVALVWCGRSISLLGVGAALLSGASIGAAAGIALVIFSAVAQVMIARKQSAQT